MGRTTGKSTCYREHYRRRGAFKIVDNRGGAGGASATPMTLLAPSTRLFTVLALAGWGGAPVAAAPESALPPMALYERYVAIDGVCGWPLLMRLPGGGIGALIWPLPSHGHPEGAVEFWKSADQGRTWVRMGVPVPHAPTQNRMTHAGGVNHAGDLVALVGGWDRRQPIGGRTAAEVQATAVPFNDSRTLSPVPARSRDGGVTWEQAAAIPPAPGAQGYVPYGRIGRLPNQELGVVLYREDVSFYTSADDGTSWAKRGQLSEARFSNETTWTELQNGDLFAASRTSGDQSVMAYRSTDSGRTWVEEGPLTLPNQHPADLWRLPDDSLLLTYGVRNAGHWAVHLRWGDATGRKWSAPTVLVELEGATNQRFAPDPPRDGGYPSTVQLDDGTMVTAYYSRGMPSHNRYHVGVVRWQLRAAAPAR
jgi:hypothetical protein